MRKKNPTFFDVKICQIFALFDNFVKVQFYIHKQKYFSGLKVQLFSKGHKNLRHLPRGFDIYLVNVKTMKKNAQTFVAFSEKLNFMFEV